MYRRSSKQKVERKLDEHCTENIFTYFSLDIRGLKSDK